MPNLPDGAPRPSHEKLTLNGYPFLVATDAQGAPAWQTTHLAVQEGDPVQEFAIPIGDFSKGSGYTYEGPAGTYDYAYGWDTTTPGRPVTWPLRMTGESFIQTTADDSRGWQFVLSNYLYVCRGRYVHKYKISDAKDSVSAIISTHDLGPTGLIAGRPAVWQGRAYVPRKTSTAPSTITTFHQLTTVGSDATIEVQTIVMSGTPTGGTWTVTFDGKTSSTIAYNANEAAVQTGLRTIPGLERVTNVQTGVSPDFTNTITMTAAPAALATQSPPQMTSSTASLTGGAPVLTHATPTPSGNTVDQWDVGAGKTATCFTVEGSNLVRAATNVVSKCSTAPLVDANWGPEYQVGDTG